MRSIDRYKINAVSRYSRGDKYERTREQLNKKYVEFPVLECFENQTKENYISKT